MRVRPDPFFDRERGPSRLTHRSVGKLKATVQGDPNGYIDSLIYVCFNSREKSSALLRKIKNQAVVEQSVDVVSFHFPGLCLAVIPSTPPLPKQGMSRHVIKLRLFWILSIWTILSPSVSAYGDLSYGKGPTFADMAKKLPAKLDPSVEYTIVLSVFRRMFALERMLDALLKQTHQPKEVWVTGFALPDHLGFVELANGYRDALPEGLRSRVKLCFNDPQLKYFGRIQLALSIKTKYVMFFDDDMIPGEGFANFALRTLQVPEYSGLLAGKGNEIKLPMLVRPKVYAGPLPYFRRTNETSRLSEVCFYLMYCALNACEDFPIRLSIGDRMVFPIS